MTEDAGMSTFLAECAELLGSMETILLRCEQGARDPEIINELFRAAHTIKGSAGLFALDSIVAFTHVVESVLDRARRDHLPISPAAAAILLECTDHIGVLVKAIEGSGQTDPAVLQAGTDLLARLTAESGYDAAVRPPAAAGDGTAPGAPGAADTANVWHVSVRFDEGVLKNGMDPLSFIRYLATLGSISGLQVIEAGLPELARFDPECCYLGFEICLRTTADRARIASAFDFVRDDCTLTIVAPQAATVDYVQLIRDLPEADGPLGDLLIRCGLLTEERLEECLALQKDCAAKGGTAPPIGQLLVEGGFVKPAFLDAVIERQSNARASKARVQEGPAIRVDRHKLDRLIDWIGELTIAGAATGALARQAGLPSLLESAQQLARIVGEVRDQALQLRMVPIGNTFSKFRRVVRDVSRETGKNIGLQVSGAETELDRTLVEGITDPLTHLVRNAIDHGIEAPSVRKSRGKPAIGMVRLNAYHDAGTVVIEVADDGGGLQRERIVRKATERGLIGAADTLSDEQVYALIFEPGFSTAEQVTNLSGRGVGMDVVKRNITALRGTVEVHSKEGQGTRICIRLPLTLAIIDGFHVSVGASEFIIPLNVIEKCIETPPNLQSEAGAVSSYTTDQETVLPLIRLREMFELPASARRRRSVVVVKSGADRAGIVVDELHGELQAVIKPLSRLFNEVHGIGGSSVLGNGSVALILDIPGLIARSHTLHGGLNNGLRSRSWTDHASTN